MAETSDKATPPSKIESNILVISMILLATLLIYFLIVLWPAAIIGSETDGDLISVNLFGIFFDITQDLALLFAVGVAGGLGAVIYILRSLSWYIGKGLLGKEWFIWYITKPFIGIILAIVFYLVIRGGFFSFEASTEDTNPFSFIALGAMVGLFSEKAVKKLNDVADTMFSVNE